MDGSSLIRSVLVGAAVLLVPGDSAAADPHGHRIDPLLRAAPGSATGDPDLTAIVELPALDTAGQAALEAEGLRFRGTADGRTRRLGAFHPVTARRSVLARLAERGVRVRVSRPVAIGPGLYPTAIETQAMDLAGHGPTPTLGPLGQRVVLGTYEPGLDVFHPHFFRADGGAWPWIDVDGDDAFTPGVDAIDANLNGDVDPDETLQLLDYGFTFAGNEMGYGGAFETAWDYLYLDLNEDGQRDFGIANGFDESSPSYGEPMFMPDDADGDGVLAPDERLYLLGTSQVAAIFTGSHVWTRGVDLVEAPAHVTFGVEANHGTSTMGIMTGGQTHPFRANRGHVPDADIAVVAYPPTEGMMEDFLLEGLAWAGDEMHARVVNHSWGARNDRAHLDGSYMIDALIDAASDAGTVQVCCGGNGRELGKHREITTVDGVASFAASLPGSLFGIATSAITFDLHWPADAGSFTCSVQRPDGATHEVQEIPDGAFENLNVDAFRSDSDRGWALLSIRVSNPGGGSAGAGLWHLDCQFDGADDVVVHGHVTDGITFWQQGVAFVDSDTRSTLVAPATADECISVAGYAIQYTTLGQPEGDLEPYSSEGPRLDGAAAIDIAAPVDPVAPTNDPFHDNAYTAFSGTSGAAPMVSAIAGLMTALDPELTPQEIVQRIRDTGGVDQYVGDGDLPDPAWGHGKLRGYAAFTGEAPPPRPHIQGIELDVDFAYDGGECAATITVDDVDWNDASFRWDFEYDGIWDTEFEPFASRTVHFDEDGESFQVRVDAGERGFIVAGAVLTAEVPADCFVPPAADDTGTSTQADETDESEDDEDDDDDDDGTSDGDAEEQDGSADGCGCRASDDRPGAVLGLFTLVFAARTRRPRGRRVA